MVYSMYKKQQILYPRSKGLNDPTITRIFREEKLWCTRVGVSMFLKERFSLSRRAGCGRLTAEMKEIVEEQMQLDDAVQLHS